MQKIQKKWFFYSILSLLFSANLEFAAADQAALTKIETAVTTCNKTYDTGIKEDEPNFAELQKAKMGCIEKQKTALDGLKKTIEAQIVTLSKATGVKNYIALGERENEKKKFEEIIALLKNKTPVPIAQIDIEKIKLKAVNDAITAIGTVSESDEPVKGYLAAIELQGKMHITEATLSASLDPLKIAFAMQNLAKQTAHFSVTGAKRTYDPDTGKYGTETKGAPGLFVGGEAQLKIDGSNDDENLLNRIIKLLISLFGLLAIILYIASAYFIMTSQGDENQLQKGKTMITYTTMGLALAFCSYIIITFLMSLIYG